MITAFTVKNFKAIGEEPVRIELKPITLLFGANSAGKSSIIHALNYAYSVFIDHNLNAEYNDHSDSILNLGHFDRFVHCHSNNRSIILRFDLDFQSADIPENILINWSSLILGPDPRELYDIFPELDPRKILSNVETAYVEVEISWSHVRNNPYVSRYETGLDNKRIATIHTDDNSNKTMVCYFNKAHAAFEGFTSKFDLNRLVSYESTMSSSDNNINLRLIHQEDALPYFTKRLYLAHNIWCNYDRYLYEEDTIQPIMVAFEDFLTSVLVSPGNKVAKWLRNTLYLGPLREIPSRYFLGKISGNFNSRWRWEKGLGAWDELYRVGQIQSDQSYLSKESQQLNKDIHDWLEENIDIHYKEISDAVKSDRTIQLEYFKKFNNPIPRPPLSWDQRVTSMSKSDLLYFLKRLPADTLVNLHRVRKDCISYKNIKKHADEWLDRINDWLANEQRLNTGYEVFIERYREISSIFFKNFDEDKSKEDLLMLFKEILNEFEKIRVWLHDISRDINLKPHEIGTGISQVLPVVVAAVGTNAPLVAIEQPELHIHPAIQVQLGDLFITQSNDKKFFLIETHSEHLLLRLLRRINETSEGNLPPEMKPCTADDVAIYYLEKGAQGMRIRRLEISEDGDSKGDWPEGFFEERRAELF